MQKLLSNARIALVGQRNNPLLLLMSVAGMRRPNKHRQKLEPLPNLSRASACVWQMDREA